MLKNILSGAIFIFLLISCKTKHNTNRQRKNIAVEFMRGEYRGDSSKIDSLISDDIVSSYPIFQKIFGKEAIRGRKAFMNFINHFSGQWKDTRLTVHDTIAEGNRVVLLWSFSAISANTSPQEDSTSGQRQSWGGITMYRFNDSGKIDAEIGEESTPGPFERWNHGDASNTN